MGKTTVQTGSTVTDVDGVTRAVAQDGTVGDPIHEVDAGGEHGPELKRKEGTTVAPAKATPKKQARD
jgi:hypothetical protein